MQNSHQKHCRKLIMNLCINPFFKSGYSSQDIILAHRKLSRLFSPIHAEGGALGVYGERGMGKSTMLNYIANPPLELLGDEFQKHVFVSMNCQDTVSQPFFSDFWYQITKKLEIKLDLGPIKSKCKILLKRYDEGEALTHNDFHEVLDVAAGSCKRIVLVLDDFDCLIRTDLENLDVTRTFFQGFRSLTTRDSNKANIVVATRVSLQELCKPLSAPYLSAFENGFTTERLRCFSEKELVQLLQRVEQAGQPLFSQAEVHYVAYLSGYHPQLAQIAAAIIFDQRIDLGAPLEQTTLEEIVGEQFKSEVCFVFEALWQRATEIERLLLMLITLQTCQGKLLSGQYSLSDLPELFGERERELLELTQRGLLTRMQVNPPLYNIFSPVFQWWILKELETSSHDYLNERRKVWGNLVTQKRAEQLGSVIEFLKSNRQNIEQLGRTILRVTGWEPPKLPGA
jgi:AAA ATPase domain